MIEARQPNKATAKAARHITRLRKQAHLSQEALARAAKVHVNSIRYLESGRIIAVRLDTLSKLADALGVRVADLVQ